MNNAYAVLEFAGLWKYISDWQNVFRHFDRDRSGSIDGHELADALRSFGYTLSPTILSLLEQKYGMLKFLVLLSDSTEPGIASFHAREWVRSSIRHHI